MLFTEFGMLIVCRLEQPECLYIVVYQLVTYKTIEK